MPDSLGAAPVGEQVLADRYELRELIGHGGMAEVHRAHDRLLDRTVAVKIFRQRDDPAAQRRFDDEGRALARMAHPGLVAIFDVGTVDDRPFLVMEFVEGTSMQSLLLGGPLPLDQVLRIGGVLADALAHAHQRGVIHRDVKPSNIMLDQEGVPHLTDFGIALLAGSPRLTSVHEILGTPAYLAPEQLLDTEVGPPADVYALGLVLLECLSGELEYASGSTLEIALSRLNRPPRVPDGLPPALIDLLMAMTATEPVDRPSAEACARGLLAVLDGPETEVLPVALDPVGDEDGTTRSRPRWPLLAASVAGIAAVVAALVFLVDTPQQPLTGRTPTAAGGRAHSAPGTKPAGVASRARTPGAGARNATPTNGTLVAKEHSAPAVVPTTAATLASSVPGPTTTSPPTSPVAPPRQTTAAAQPPATASSEPPATTASSTEPPSSSEPPSDDPGP